MLLNNYNISSALVWYPLAGSLDLVGDYIPIGSDFFNLSFTLQHVSGDRAFAAYFYGIGSECSFAYPIGYCLDDIRVRTCTSTRFATFSIVHAYLYCVRDV